LRALDDTGVLEPAVKRIATLSVVLAASCAAQRAPAPAPVYSTYPPPQPAPLPPPPVLVPAPAPLPPSPLPPTALGPPAAPTDAANDGGANVALQFFAVNEAAGMRSEVSLLGRFAEGQTMEETITLVPGRCTTILAAGVGVSEIDLTLVAINPPPGVPLVLAQDARVGPYASIGEKGRCAPTGPFPMQARFIVKATRGSGTVAARAFVK
jgi:hypothetical protein